MFQIRYSEDLPIHARRAEILHALRYHQVLILAGETGSGKTTQIPKMCLEAGLAETGRIGCTQPRRVAALSVSRRVAEELGVTWGREVGCKMRFQDDSNRDTKIKFMTDGILLAEIQSDPLLRAYSTLILDEAHERSLNIDFLLGYLQSLLLKRPDLKLIITSATIDTASFSEAFGGAPIIQVSGRLWPVEIRYSPPESFFNSPDSRDDLDAPSHVMAAVLATQNALRESQQGDVLIFMPTEREIRETIELLENSLGSRIEVLGLFGRMASVDQQLIFSPGPLRRVIVATNIAETSITLPRIRYVIDTGLARVSRYNPRTRTKRLPVEPVAQSSGNQRAGRAGRVQDGICIRLYSEEDFQKRAPFSQPEIQRANLAEVILRMKAFRLGEIETFPFLNPPQSASIRAGYRLLHELGALDETNQLTRLGAELARLPVDPTLGRMLLQARSENALPETLVIAAALSIPDPRERPEDQREAAEQAQSQFADPDSDFLTLLNLWNASPLSQGRPSANALRRFCKAHFLSFVRMREWRDIHEQLADAVREIPANSTPQRAHPASRKSPRQSPQAPARQNQGQSQEGSTQEGASYTSIHRSVLAGFPSQLAQKSERNIYKAAGSRQVTLFPGSSLYERRDKKHRPKNAPAKPPEKSRQPEWIVAGEIVETSQLFARMAAGIRPDWILELAPHLCQFRYLAPHWSSKAQRVLVSERVFVLGLEVARRSVDYGLVDPAAATELFIRGALVQAEGQIPHRFFQTNLELREKVETALTRVRSGRAMDLDEALYSFYASRIQNVSSVPELNRLLKERIPFEPEFCCATEADLVGSDNTAYDRALFPDVVSLGNTALPLSYAFAPGEEEDGVTVRVPLPVAERLSQAQLQWMVPGLREEQISILLRALPKPIRKTLMPLDPKIIEVAREFIPGQGDFLSTLADFLTRKYRIHVRVSDWPRLSLPPHLQPRVEVVDKKNTALASGRDLESVQATLAEQNPVHGSQAFEKLARQWERNGLTEWNFGDLPETIHVENISGTSILAYPGLLSQGANIGIRLFAKLFEAELASQTAIRQLAEHSLRSELAYLRKELAVLAREIFEPKVRKDAQPKNALHLLGSALSVAQTALPSPQTFETSALKIILEDTLRLDPVFPLSSDRFQVLTESARKSWPSKVYQLGTWVRELLKTRDSIESSSKRYSGFQEDLQRLFPANFLDITPFPRLAHLLRYLKAIQIRAERASLQPGKDVERARQLEPFRDWKKRVPSQRHEDFRWLLEEFRVSLFAQELGTAQPVSAARLNALGGL